MWRCGACFVSTALVAIALVSCGKSEEAAAPVAAPVGPPAAVMSELAAWKSIGGVTNLRDLAPKPLPSGAANAADVYLPLVDMLRDMSMSDKELISDPWESPANTLKYVLESYEQELAIIRKAAAIPSCDWGTRFEEGADAKVEYLYSLRSAVRLLMVDARLRGNDGDVEGAAASILDMLRLADHAAADPLSICFLVRNSLDAGAADAIERVFKTQERIPKDLIEALSQRRRRSQLRRSILAEGTMVISSFVVLAGGTPSTPVEQQAMSDAMADGLVWNLRVLRLFAEQADRPYYQLTAAADAPLLPTGARVPELHMDVELLDRMCRTSASVENLVAVARVALQLREYKASYGDYPDPATFKTPEDALTGMPITYLRDADGFTLRVARSGLSDQNDEYDWEW